MPLGRGVVDPKPKRPVFAGQRIREPLPRRKREGTPAALRQIKENEVAFLWLVAQPTA